MTSEELLAMTEEELAIWLLSLAAHGWQRDALERAQTEEEVMQAVKTIYETHLGSVDAKLWWDTHSQRGCVSVWVRPGSPLTRKPDRSMPIEKLAKIYARQKLHGAQLGLFRTA